MGFDIMKPRYALILLWILSIALAWAPDAHASDSLTVDRAIRMTLANDPAVRQAERQVDAAAANIEINRTRYYPDFSISGAYMRLGPVASISLAGGESFDLYPADNYDAHLQFYQLLYDFGERRTSVRLAEAGKKSAQDNIDVVKSDLAFRTMAAFNTILILQRSIDVINDQINALNRHLEITRNKAETGSATKFDVLTTQVRIAVATDGLIDARNGLRDQEITLRQLTGLPDDQPLALRGDFTYQPNLNVDVDSLLALARAQRPELIRARDAEAQAELHIEMASLGDKPTLGAMATAGFKNGYIPNLNQAKANFTAGVSLQIPVFNGRRSHYRTVGARADLDAVRARTAGIEQEVAGEVQQAVAALKASLDKIRNSEIQVRQAEQAISLANTQYEAGVVTNLDLLDAQTAYAQAKLIHLRALYQYTMSRNRLDQAVGAKMW